MRQINYLVHLLAWLAFIVAVRFAMMLWTDWLGLLVLLPLPFYFIHFLLPRLLPGNHSLLASAQRYLRLRAWYRNRHTNDELDSPYHRPRGFCPKCGYALNPGRCPECGHEVTRRNIRIERYGPLHRHRGKLISTGVAVLLILAGCLFFTRVNWVSKLPFDAIVTLHKWGNDDARDELEKRVRSQSLSKAQLNVLYEATVVPKLSIPQPYPHDAQVPCDLRFDMTMRCLNPFLNSPLCFIRNCTCEVDGESIEHRFESDDFSEAGTVLPFVLPPADPGKHIVRIRGEVACSGCSDLREMPHYVVFRIPFEVEITFETDDRSAAEMMEASEQLLTKNRGDAPPLVATVYDIGYNHDYSAMKTFVEHKIIVDRTEACRPSCAIAGLVLARPKGRENFTHLGNCYLCGKDRAYFEINDFPELIEAEELDVRIEPDPRQAAYGSKMQCRSYYGKPLEISARRPSVVSLWKASAPPADGQ